MKGRNLFFTAVLVLLAGIVLIITNQSIHSTGVVVTGGILFIMAGLLNVAVFMGARDKEGKARQGVVGSGLGWVVSVAAVILGLAMLIFQSTFVTLVPFIFGVLVAFGALYQYFLLAYGSRPVRLPGWLYIIPTAMVGAAVYLFTLAGGQSDRLIMLVTGISLSAFGVTTLLEASLLGAANRRARKAASATATSAPAATPKDEDDQPSDGSSSTLG